MLRNQVRKCCDGERQMPADEVVDDRRRAAIGHAGRGKAEQLFELPAGEMRDGAAARHAIARFRGVGLDPGHQLLEILDVDRRAYGDRELEAGELRDGNAVGARALAGDAGRTARADDAAPATIGQRIDVPLAAVGGVAVAAREAGGACG